MQEKKYGDRLLATLRKYHNRAIETAQVIEELIDMAKDFQEAMKREEALGLNPDELAFYDALANNESAVRELGDEVLKKIAYELTEKLRKSTTSIGWCVTACAPGSGIWCGFFCVVTSTRRTKCRKRVKRVSSRIITFVIYKHYH